MKHRYTAHRKSLCFMENTVKDDFITLIEMGTCEIHVELQGQP